MRKSEGDSESGSVVPEGISVFIVEDDEATRHSLAASLAALDCEVQSFSTCEAFLAAASGVPPGCLLLDYYFENLMGLELLDRLRDIGVSFPTVLFTGRFDRYLRTRASAY